MLDLTVHNIRLVGWLRTSLSSLAIETAGLPLNNSPSQVRLANRHCNQDLYFSAALQDNLAMV